MSNRINSTWKWIKDHKKEIAIAGAISVVSAVGGIILYKKIGCVDAVTNWTPPKLNISDTSIDGNLVRHHDGAVEIFIYDDIPLTAMGELGEYLSKTIPDLADNPTSVYLEMAIAEPYDVG